MEKDPALILKLPTLKLITDYVEANKDGEPCYDDVKLKHLKKGYIVSHAIEIVKSIVECFDKRYGNTISETSKEAVNVHAYEGDCLILHISPILNCNVWPDSMEID